MEVRKQISFDLDTNILKQILGEDNYTQAYALIRKFMENNDFVHIEGSVYMSVQPMDNVDVLLLLDDMKIQIPYITKCVREMHQADISEVHSLNLQFDYDGTPGKYAQKDADVKKEVGSHSQEPEKAKAQKRSLKDRVDAHKEMANQRKQQRQDKQPEKPKNHNQEL